MHLNTNKQTNKQPSKQPSKQASKQTNKQTNTHTHTGRRGDPQDKETKRHRGTEAQTKTRHALQGSGTLALCPRLFRKLGLQGISHSRDLLFHTVRKEKESNKTGLQNSRVFCWSQPGVRKVCFCILNFWEVPFFG